MLRIGTCLSVCCAMFTGLAAQAAGPDPAALAKARQSGIEFLKKSQSEDGTWTSSEAVGISGLAVFGLLDAGVPADDPVVKKGLAKLASYAQPDGRISPPGGRIPAYETAIAVMTLTAANASGEYTDILAKADKFLRGVQFDTSKDVEKSDPRYGGAGYGPGSGRPDLSNTAFFLEAL